MNSFWTRGVYLSTLTGGGRTLDTSEPLFPEEEMMVSPSDLSWSTKLSTSFPLAPSFRALLWPLDLEERTNNSSADRWGELHAQLGAVLHFMVPYRTGAGVILGFSGSTMVSVMRDPDDMLLTLPNPPNAGTFFPERSASLLACCSSFAFLLISALASRSWVCKHYRPLTQSFSPFFSVFMHVQRLTSLTARNTFSSWESISVKVRIWARLTFSL